MTFVTHTKTRRFQNTSFGAERDMSSGDKIPSWKRDIYDNLYSRAKEQRRHLLQKLRETRENNDALSPEDKIQKANECISSFKDFIVNEQIGHLIKDHSQSKNTSMNVDKDMDIDMDIQDISTESESKFKELDYNYNYNISNSDIHNKINITTTTTTNNNRNTNTNDNDDDNKNIDKNKNNNTFINKTNNNMCQFVNKPDDEDIGLFRQELNAFMEDMFLKEIRDQEYALVWEQQEMCYKREIESMYPEMQDTIVICPLCKKSELGIETVNNKIKIYDCRLCWSQFQSLNPNLQQKKKDESENEHGKRLLKALNSRLNEIVTSHTESFQCLKVLEFQICEKKKVLQAWCPFCSFNDLVV